MITLIVGQNAIGKTVYLQNKIKDMSRNNNVISNLIESNYLNSVPYNRERIDDLKDILDTENIAENDDMLGISTDEVRISKAFALILTLICKDLEYLYLDEPEFGLSYREIGFLIWFLCRVENSFKEIEIVTHSEMLLSQLENIEVKTVEYDIASRKFVKTDLKEDAYVTID